MKRPYLPILSIVILFSIFLLIPKTSKSKLGNQLQYKTHTPVPSPKEIQHSQVEGATDPEKEERFYSFLKPKDLQSNYDSQEPDN